MAIQSVKKKSAKASPDSDLENKLLSQSCHCEHLKGAWQSNEVVARG
jgi:hypothetical protein